MEEQSVMLNLVDILFSYAYDQRTNEGDSNVSIKQIDHCTFI